VATRAPRPNRFSHESKATAVDIDRARAEVGRRIEKGAEQGNPFLRVVVPTPREPKPEQVIDLSFLYALPNLADTLAEAFLDWTATTQRTASRGGEAAHLRVGLVAFLVETGRTATTPEGLTTELANAFIGWLNEKRTGRDELLQENSRAKLFGTLRRLIKHLRQLPKWAGRIPRDLYIRDSPWPMRHLKRKATEILDSEDLRRLLSACAEEVTSTIHRIEEGWRLREEARDSLPSSHQGYMAYADLGSCLAAVETQLRGQILRMDVVNDMDRDVGEAVRKLHGGLISLGEYFYPTPRLLMPFIVLLSLYTGVNTGSLVESQRGGFWVASVLGHRRFYWKVWKERAKRWQAGSIACDEDMTHPATLVQFLMRWTEYLRPLVHPSESERLFLFVPPRGKRPASSFHSKWGSLLSGSWEYGYHQFLKEHGLGLLGTRRFRVTGLEIVHQVTGGDLPAMQAWANHARSSTTERNYVGDGAKQRDEERLAEIMLVRGRWRQTQGKIETRGRPEHTDIGAATPGWTCLDPYAGLHGPKDTLCSAYAQCPVCPLGSVDFQSPYACAQAHNLLEAVRRAAETMAPQAWLKRMAPVQQKLLDTWLPQFSAPVRKAAQKLSLPPLPVPE
jgi:hypothetical protein